MEIRRLQHFLALHEARSFRRAAQRCGISPQALSKSIKRLEETLGVKLFERDTRSVEPTIFASEILPFAQNIDAESRSLRRAIDALLDTGANRLIIGTGITAAVELVPATVLAVREHYPRLVVEIVEGTYETLTPRLLRGQLDVIVSVLTTDTVDDLIQWEVLTDEPYRLCARSGHPLAEREGVGLEMLLDYPWIGGDDEDLVAEQLRVVFEAAGLSLPVPAITTNSIASAISLAVRSNALLCLPEVIVRRELQQGLLTMLDLDLPALSRPTVAFFRKNSTRSLESLQFIRELRRQFGIKA